ncbi:MAG: hypothetical protein RRA92_00240 [Gemmatimonadota bacterium]|nr:hypothetical protein [Gemmatimonadota bacterium]
MREAPGSDGRALALLGLARRAGRVALGTQAVLAAADSAAGLHLVLVARDAGGNARDRVLPKLRARGVPWRECGTAAQLARALGRGRVVVAGVSEPGLAERLCRLLDDGSQEMPAGT